MRDAASGGEAAAEIADRLEVHGAHGRHLRDGEIDDGADLVDVDAGNERRRQHHADAGLAAIADRLRLQPHQLGAAQASIDVVGHAVELQEDAVEPRLGEGGEIGGLARDAHAIGVQLHEFEAARAHQGDDFGQVVAHRRLAARKLDVNAPAGARRACRASRRSRRGWRRRRAGSPRRSTPDRRDRSARSPPAARSSSADDDPGTGRSRAGSRA